jgi:hypothetical protein
MYSDKAVIRPSRTEYRCNVTSLLLVQFDEGTYQFGIVPSWEPWARRDRNESISFIVVVKRGIRDWTFD